MIKTTSILMLALLASGFLHAESSQGRAPSSQGINYQTLNTQQRQELANEWGLTESDLFEYQRIMEGRRGIWSPGLDPITALGVHAETAEERARFAAIFVKQEAERVTKELAFQRAVDEAWASLHPSVPRLANNQRRQLNLRETIERLGFASLRECSKECKEKLTRLVGYMDESGPDLKLDIFIVGATSDKELRDWVENQELPLKLIREEKITINFAEGFDVKAAYPKEYVKKAGSSWREI